MNYHLNFQILSWIGLFVFSQSQTDAQLTGLRFFLYTKQTRNAPTELKPNDLSTLTNVVANGKVRILCHGFTSVYTEAAFPQALKNVYLNQPEDQNVILVDWAALCTALVGYNTASANAKKVGAEIAKLVEFLIANGSIQLNKVHFIGHSLGGQVGAFISGNLSNGSKIPRLTGLDPARENFEATLPAADRLDASDATFVDIINTSGGGVFSTSSSPDAPRGTVDFYPNGGVKQTGCGLLGVEYPRTCSHNRAFLFFTESVTTTVGFKACKCTSWTQYMTPGACPCTEFTNMGEFVSTSASGSYYLKTNAAPPFAQG